CAIYADYARSTVNRLGRAVFFFVLYSAVASMVRLNHGTRDGATRSSWVELRNVNEASRGDASSMDDQSDLDQVASGGSRSPVRSIFDFDGDRTGVHLRRDRLLLPDEMPFDSWRELGSRLALIASYSAWWLGDWLIYGEQAYGDRYRQVV